jgi:hypothetical protein
MQPRFCRCSGSRFFFFEPASQPFWTFSSVTRSMSTMLKLSSSNALTLVFPR